MQVFCNLIDCAFGVDQFTLLFVLRLPCSMLFSGSQTPALQLRMLRA